jgi:acyl-CoA dehydrogenase
MTGLTWAVIFVFSFCVLAYQRASLIVWTISAALLLSFATFFIGAQTSMMIAWVVAAVLFVPLNAKKFRQQWISQPLFNFYRRIMPVMSKTEREAISAGTITWEGDLFRGNPDWNKLLHYPAPKLSAEEKAFLDGPVETVCSMTSDWEVTQNLLDLPKDVWTYLKEQGFFGLIIPKEYGGKAFSAYAHSQILTKLSSVSITLSSTVAVPNSLGPAELLLHYGTEEQKNYYLPRLAKGEEIPCFALTSPTAGSDAGSMTDHGIVCKGMWEGKEVVGIRLTFDKRYITLAPVATVIGLAFKLYDPEQLLGTKEDIGITCALIPRNTTGLVIGRRHFPVNTPFQNGPLHGKDVFIPMDFIIGGAKQAGKGWRMLMECLSVGRAISLPANTLGGAKLFCSAGGAYTRIRRQFNMPIGRFEGIEEPLAFITANAYMMDATRTLAVSYIDQGEKPSVASAIVKYNVTEKGRSIVIRAMDIYGGKGICLGPRNFIGRNYEAAPIAITVEGANILTRNMIIYGQGALRCHPYVLAELEAAKMSDTKQGLIAFDNAVMKHIAFGISNVVRSFVLAVTGSRIVKAPNGKFKRYYQYATRFASILAMLSDVAMLVLGGSLKRRESFSARLGDVLSNLYIMSAVLKLHHDQGQPKEDNGIVQYSLLDCLYQSQEAISDIIANFPNKPLRYVLTALIFPLGKRFTKPSFKLNHAVAQTITNMTGARERLANGMYSYSLTSNHIADIHDAFPKVIAAEPIEKTIRLAVREGKVNGYTLRDQAQDALKQQVITQAEYDIFLAADIARAKVIAVDDFTTEELQGRAAKNATIQSLYEQKANSA